MDSHYLNEVLKGNTQAFGHFIKTYQNKAFGIAISITKHEDDAKDVVQESFITAFSSLSKFRNDAKFSTWFYRIVINAALQYIKQNKRKINLIESYSISDNEKIAQNNAINQLERDELIKLIKNIFKQLPPKEALVLQLFYIDEYSLLEIVSISGFTKSSIKVLLHRGRNHFYNILKEEKIKRPHS